MQTEVAVVLGLFHVLLSVAEEEQPFFIPGFMCLGDKKSLVEP